MQLKKNTWFFVICVNIQIVLGCIIISKGNPFNDFEGKLIEFGLIDVSIIDSTIYVDLRYSSKHNFLGKDLYGDFNKCYLRKEVAEKLVKAQKILKEIKNGYSLVIFDAVRPVHIQQMMWSMLDMPRTEKSKYISNPDVFSLHNFGAAVDVSIIDENKKELDMGTSFDSFEELAYPVLEEQMLLKGLLTRQQIDNRKLLRIIMNKAGFTGIETEWWHFNACSRKEANKKYPVIDIYKTSKPDDKLIVDESQDVNITFKVQIKTSVKPISTKSKIFKDVIVTRYYHKGLYKYVTGEFKDLKSAYLRRFELVQLGFQDAFVAGFNNNKRIPIKEAVDLMQ